MIKSNPQLSLEQQAFARDMKSPRYRIAFRNNLTRSFRKQPYLNRKGRLNWIISVYGKTGSGKSIAMWYLCDLNAKAYETEFTAEHVHFDLFNFQQSLEKSGPGDMLVLDEQVEVFGEGSIQMQRAINNIEMTVREGEVSMGYVGPDLRLHSHHYILLPRLKLWEMPQYKNHMKVFNWVFDGLKSGPNHPIGFVITGLPKGCEVDNTKTDHKDKIIWSEEFLRYREKKHAFIDRVKKGQISSGSENIVKMVAEKFIEKYKKELEAIKSKKKIKSMLDYDKEFRKNLSVGQKDSVVEMMIYICELEGIPCGLVK